MNCLIESYDNVVTRLPLEPPLPGDDVIRVDCLPSQNFDSKSFYSYPSLRPAESLVFWVEEACILEALNRITLVKACSTKGLAAPRPMIFMAYYFNYSPIGIPPEQTFFTCLLLITICYNIQTKHSITLNKSKQKMSYSVERYSSQQSSPQQHLYTIVLL